MMSDYYSKEDLIELLKIHLIPQDANRNDWDKIIDDGEIYPKQIEGVDGCYIYYIPCSQGGITIFVHPLICSEVYYDGWTNKEVYMGREQGEIW